MLNCKRFCKTIPVIVLLLLVITSAAFTSSAANLESRYWRFHLRTAKELSFRTACMCRTITAKEYPLLYSAWRR